MVVPIHNHSIMEVGMVVPTHNHSIWEQWQEDHIGFEDSLAYT